MRSWVLAAGLMLIAAAGRAETVLGATYLKLREPPRPVLSNLDPIPEDEGIAGARLALADNMTTGSFLGQSYTLDVVDLQPGADALTAARDALATAPFLILAADAATVMAVADLPEARDALIFSVAAQDRILRDEGCRANVFLTAVSYAMRADALMQALLVKRWTRLALISGPTPADRAFAEALKASATKFGLEIVAEKDWSERADLRRTASAEVPLFTQDLPDHDVLLIADEADDFARYLAYNTWLPRPVAGSEGMTPVGWAPVLEQWGAAQLQSRFEDQSARQMRPRDYAAWAAMRTLGEAMTRTNSADPATLRAFILSDEFELAGFKGRPLSYRRWNGQLRQPVPVVHPRALVAEAPVTGFLHQRNELDTLGLDEGESACTLFGDAK